MTPSAPLAPSAVWIARAYLALATLGLVIGGVAALGMRLELWAPGIDAPPQQYEALLSAHSVAMLFGLVLPGLLVGVGNLQVAEVARGVRTPTVWLGAVAVIPWLAGLATLAESASMTYGDPRASSTIALGLALVAASLVLSTLHFAAVLVTGRGRRAPISAIVLVVALVWEAISMILYAVRLAELLEPVGSWEAVVPSWPAAALGAGAVAFSSIGRALDAEPRGAVGPPAMYAVFGLLPCAWLALAAIVFLATLSVDVHLHDTYFVLGATHLVGSLFVLTSFAALHAWSDVLLGRRPRDLLARGGALLACAGAIGTSLAMLALGSRGMPRRYVDYLPQLELHHRLVTAAALTFTLGALLVAASLLAGRKAPARS